jgi:hypothetical protein
MDIGAGAGTGIGAGAGTGIGAGVGVSQLSSAGVSHSGFSSAVSSFSLVHVSACCFVSVIEQKNH